MDLLKKEMQMVGVTEHDAKDIGEMEADDPLKECWKKKMSVTDRSDNLTHLFWGR